MISLVLSMIRARPAQALVLLALSAFVTGVAVAGDAYPRAMDRTVVATEAAGATPAERRIAVYTTGDGLTELAERVAATPGAVVVAGSETAVVGLAPEDGYQPSSLVFRDGVCAHLIVLSGRCPVGLGEVMLGEATAARAGRSPGDTTGIGPAVFDAETRKWVIRGIPTLVSIVGVYRPRAMDDEYWAGQPYFGQDITGAADEPGLVSSRTMLAVNAKPDLRSLTATLPAVEITPDRLAALRNTVEPLAGKHGIGTELPVLLDRIARGQQSGREMLPRASVPLMGFGWLVIVVAVAYGRRSELALLSMRGVWLPYRAWLSAGESLLPVLAGVPLGYLLGALAVALSPAGGAPVAVPPGAVAAAGSVVAVLVAQRRIPVLELLRRVPARHATARSLAVEAVVVAVAVVAVIQDHVLAPALVALSVALVAARALAPATAAIGALALRRGRLATALAALLVSRRPDGRRLFVVVAVAVALLALATALADVTGRERSAQAAVEQGADRVVTVQPVATAKLLSTVRAIDPDGRYAMAVVTLTGDRGVPILAVDSPRLAAVARWPDRTPPVAALRPPTAEPVVLRSDGVTVDATLDHLAFEAARIRLVARFVTPGGIAVVASIGRLEVGRHTYRASVPGCADGCRLVAFTIDSEGYAGGGLLRLHGMTDAAGAVLVSGERFADPRSWHPTPDELYGTEGLRWEPGRRDGDVGLRPADTPSSLPVLAPAGLGGVKGPVPLTAIEVGQLPRVGRSGVLVDLEYLDRAVDGQSTPTSTEVWLGPAAPPDVVDRLRAGGLAVVSDRGIAEVLAARARSGPALALWFHLLAGLLAVVVAVATVGLVAAVDRRDGAGDLVALRVQGLPPAAVTKSLRRGYVGVALAAALCGAAGAVVAWAVTRSGAWPITAAAVVPWAIATVALCAAGLAGAALVWRATGRPSYQETLPQRPVDSPGTPG